MEVSKDKSLPAFDYEEVSWDHEDFFILCRELDSYLDRAIGGAEKREKYQGFNHLDTMDYVLIAYENHIPVGCGALREYTHERSTATWEGESLKQSGNGAMNRDKSIELKRVYVRPEYRTQGVGTGILQRLMRYAREKGYREILLETGEFLKESCRLYTRFGFERIANYGAYANMKESLCMGKKLSEIHYSMERSFSVRDIENLYKSVGWLSARYGERLVQAFQKAGTVISAWEGKRLVGLIEVLDDGELTAYIHYLLVRPEYQRQGIGEGLLELIKERYKNYLYLIVISEEKKNVRFYEKCGFTSVNQATPLQNLKCQETVNP